MSWFKSVLRFREAPVTIALIVLVSVTAVANPRFLAPQSVKDLLLNATILMILAAGQAVVLITRNVDLSVGSILGISGFLTGTLFATVPGIPIPVVFLAGIAIGALLGAINGLLVSVARVPALVITLGTLYIYRGINNAWAGGKEYFSGDRPEAFGNLSIDTILGFPIITLIAIIVIAVLALVLGYTRRDWRRGDIQGCAIGYEKEARPSRGQGKRLGPPVVAIAAHRSPNRVLLTIQYAKATHHPPSVATRLARLARMPKNWQ